MSSATLAEWPASARANQQPGGLPVGVSALPADRRRGIRGLLAGFALSAGLWAAIIGPIIILRH